MFLRHALFCHVYHCGVPLVPAEAKIIVFTADNYSLSYRVCQLGVTQKRKIVTCQSWTQDYLLREK